MPKIRALYYHGGKHRPQLRASGLRPRCPAKSKGCYSEKSGLRVRATCTHNNKGQSHHRTGLFAFKRWSLIHAGKRMERQAVERRAQRRRLHAGVWRKPCDIMLAFRQVGSYTASYTPQPYKVGHVNGRHILNHCVCKCLLGSIRNHFPIFSTIRGY